MNKHEKVANIVAFLLILFSEENHLLEAKIGFSPDYIIEKFERYVLSAHVEYPWGMHPSMKKGIFQKYIDKWELELQDE